MRGVVLRYKTETMKATYFRGDEKRAEKILGRMQGIPLTILGLDGRKGGSKYP